MIKFPEKKPKLKRDEGRDMIFCAVRKRWLICTPEEWVRQNFILYLHHELKWPLVLLAAEKSINLFERKKRFDIVAYKHDKPFLLIECKEMTVPLSEQTLLQALRYNIPVDSSFLIITNGSYTAAFQRKKEGLESVDSIPSFE